MIHFHYIGYFDPQVPSPTNVLRPMPHELVSRLVRRYEVSLGEDVEVLDGYLLSRLGHEGELHPFEAALVAEGCVVMTQEPCRVVQPRAAALAFWSWFRSLPAPERPPVTQRPIGAPDPGPRE